MREALFWAGTTKRIGLPLTPAPSLLRKSDCQYLSSVPHHPHPQAMYYTSCIAGKCDQEIPSSIQLHSLIGLKFYPKHGRPRLLGPSHSQPHLLIGLSFHTREDKPRRPRANAPIQHLIHKSKSVTPREAGCYPCIPFQSVGAEVLLKGKAGHRTESSISISKGTDFTWKRK